MRLSRTGIGAVATALAATLVLAGCSGDDATETPETTEPTVEQTAAPEAEQTGPVDVPDVTNIILETAQGNLMRKGLESTVVDESGAAVTVDDATAYVVVAQDPADGQLEAGETVTLTVVPRG